MILLSSEIRDSRSPYWHSQIIANDVPYGSALACQGEIVATIGHLYKGLRKVWCIFQKYQPEKAKGTNNNQKRELQQKQIHYDTFLYLSYISQSVIYFVFCSTFLNMCHKIHIYDRYIKPSWNMRIVY